MIRIFRESIDKKREIGYDGNRLAKANFCGGMEYP